MIATAPFGSTGHESTRTHLRRRGARRRHPGARPTARSSCCSSTASTTSTPRPRTATPSCGSPRGCAHTADDFFLATKTGERDLRGRARADPPLARPARRRPRRPDPAAQPGRRDEWETALARRRRARGRDRGARRRARALHRRHRPRPARSPRCTGAASSASRSTRCSLPYNYARCSDARYAADFEALAAVCARAQRRACRRSRASRRAPWDGRAQTAATWYEPLREQADIDLAVHWVLGRPGVFLNTVGDVELLPQRARRRRAASSAPVGRGDGRARSTGGPRRRSSERPDYFCDRTPSSQLAPGVLPDPQMGRPSTQPAMFA